MKSDEVVSLYSKITNNIAVSVNPDFLPEASTIEDRQFSFSYTIRIENQSQDTVQLLSRHWKVFANGQLVGEIKGQGVVGMQPVLGPNSGFQYTSGAEIPEPFGSMSGEYTLLNQATNQLFQVVIPEFDLVCPLFLQ